MKLTKKTLKKIAKPVTFEYPFKVQKIGVEMFHFMKKEGGIGLAATQVGLNIQLFVTLVDGKYTAFYNPKLLNYCTDFVEFDEGCLSFPKESYIIERPETIKVEYYDYLGIRFEKILSGLAARVWLHEYDHLMGITFQQRLDNDNIPENMQYVKE